MFSLLRRAKNRADFFLRNKITFSMTIPEVEDIHPLSFKLQKENEEFLMLFDWPKFLGPRKKIILADVGTRTFAIAPVLQKIFQVFDPEIHGIEIDAYRRFTNFRSRADYGRYYAQRVSKGYFHAMDFLKWQKPADVILMLNPFVTPGPLLSWGLPLNELKPQALFDHAFSVLSPSRGVLVASSPNADEFEKVADHARLAGFRELEKKVWEPSIDSLHKQPRLGVLLQS